MTELRTRKYRSFDNYDKHHNCKMFVQRKFHWHPCQACQSVRVIVLKFYISLQRAINLIHISNNNFLLNMIFYFQMMAHNTTVQLGGTAFLVCKVAGVDRVGVNWVCFWCFFSWCFWFNDAASAASVSMLTKWSVSC